MTGAAMHEELSTWADRLERVIAQRGLTAFDRVAVVAETASTQDLAREMAAGRPGLALFAGRQTAGRGRLGRKWQDTATLGLAVTFVQDAAGAGPLAIGVGACRTVEAAIGADGARVGLQWPNDIVERGPPGRKLAGVLIEQSGGSALVGIGINVLQGESDWPDELRGRATSLRALGSTWSRIDVAERLMAELDGALRLRCDELTREWTRRDVLVGSVRVFEHDGRRIEGRVEAIDPGSAIVVRTEHGGVIRLPAETTSLMPPA